MERNILEDGTVGIRIKRGVLAVALALIVGFGGGYGVAKLTESSPPTPALVSEPSATQTPEPATEAVINLEDYPWADVSIEGRPFLGPEDAPITIVEFTDFQCPFCGEHAREILTPLMRSYNNRIRYVIRHYPITAIHPMAAKSAQAAECAYDQDRFWEYRYLLFREQTYEDRLPLLDSDRLKELGQGLGMDEDVFNNCFDTSATADRVAQDLADGRRYGVAGTPTFFINGRQIAGAQSLEGFKAIIDAILEK